MDRFKLSFSNSKVVSQAHYNNLAAAPIKTAAPTSVALNAPMIDRVYRAKPGCSACGKKVA